MTCDYTKLHRCAAGTAMGFLTAILIFIYGIFAMWGYGITYVDLIGSIYIGYEASLLGAILGAVWGFVHGFIIGYLFAWFYNIVLGKCCKKKEQMLDK